MFGKNYTLIIDHGEPHDKGTKIALSSDEIIIGRPWQNHQPDIPFTSLFISKKHVSISFENNQFILNDLSSKHGTRLNGFEIVPYQPQPIQKGDLISLAHDTVLMRVTEVFESEAEHTIDLIQSKYLEKMEKQKSLRIDSDRREVFLDGDILNLYGKDIELLLLLFENCNRAVNYNDIRLKVWPERPLDIETNIPDVGNDEITALVYRLRKRLNKCGNLIVTIPRFGYRLDL